MSDYNINSQTEQIKNIEENTKDQFILLEELEQTSKFYLI